MSCIVGVDLYLKDVRALPRNVSVHTGDKMARHKLYALQAKDDRGTPMSDSSLEKAGVVKETERRFGDRSYWLYCAKKKRGMHGAVARSLATSLDTEGRMRPVTYLRPERKSGNRSMTRIIQSSCDATR